MDIFIDKSQIISGTTIQISGSKSQTNRLLVLQKLFGTIYLENQSDSDDSEVLRAALASDQSHIDIHHAGTAMRFLTAYFAMQPGKEVTLTGSLRMTQRPIGILVEALQSLGADITYLDRQGYPPLKIRGKEFDGGQVWLSAAVSSQYITAMMLIAPFLKTGLTLNLTDQVTSRPYIMMTVAVLRQLGVEVDLQERCVKVAPVLSLPSTTLVVESDWSSASYFYAIVALSPIGTKMTLKDFDQSSLQGDAALIWLFKDLGVQTKTDHRGRITIEKINKAEDYFKADLNDTPDLAQTLAVCCFGLGIACELTGLKTLKIKETDRLSALQTELGKLGASITTTSESLSLKKAGTLRAAIAIDTYEDHRMAMAFSALSVLVPIEIRDAQVVTKSYKNFWEDLNKLGFNLKVRKTRGL